jgi:hypothetical protein
MNVIKRKDLGRESEVDKVLVYNDTLSTVTKSFTLFNTVLELVMKSQEKTFDGKTLLLVSETRSLMSSYFKSLLGRGAYDE